MTSFRSFVVGVAAASLAALGACSDSVVDPVSQVPAGIVVLNGFGQPGVTLLGDTGTTSTRIDFGASYDGGGMALAHDTVLTTSSKGGGDLLYVADLRAGSLLKVQMPAASNPAGAAFTGGLGGGNVVVALRDVGAIAVVRVTGGTGSVVSQLSGAGRCPSDVDVQAGQFWVLDANENCGPGGNYTPLGSSRLIRVPATGTARDTVVLGAVRGATNMIVSGDVAFVASAGVADFSQYPITTFTTPGAIVKVDLARRAVLQTVSLPQGTYGAGMRLGADGSLYVTSYTSTDFAHQDVFAFDQSLQATGVRAAGKQSLDLRRADGTAPVCSAATADARGRIYCVTNGAGSAASLLVFDRSGVLLRTAPAGQGGVDVAIR